MEKLLVISLPAIAAAYLWYVTVQGYRTGVLRVRTTIFREKNPRMFWVTLAAVTILSLVSAGAVAVLAYGETHPEWRRPHGKPAALLQRNL
jgi:hypothetical protein